MIKIVEDNNINYAKIIRASHVSKETEFFTDDDAQMQFGFIKREKNFKTGTHYHNHLEIENSRLDEIYIFKKGSARVDFFNEKGEYIKSIHIFKDDILILYRGAHNITYYEDSEAFLIKSGAYAKGNDTTRIIGAHNLEIKIEED